MNHEHSLRAIVHDETRSVYDTETGTEGQIEKEMTVRDCVRERGAVRGRKIERIGAIEASVNA